MRNGSRVFIVVIMAAVMAMGLALSSQAAQKEPIAAGSIHSFKKPFILNLSQSPGIPFGEEAAAEALKQCVKNPLTPDQYSRIGKPMNELPKTAAGNIFKQEIDPEA